MDLVRRGTELDLLITDFAMPGMNGMQLIQAVREVSPKLPALLATGYAELPNGKRVRDSEDRLAFTQKQSAQEIANLLAGGR